MGLNFYLDSNSFERLTKRGNECHWNEFIDECAVLKIDFFKGCNPIFTTFLLLERIGLGEILRPLQGSPGYKFVVKLIQTYIKKMPDPKSLSASDLEKLQYEIADLLEGMGEIFRSLLYQLKELEVGSLLKRLDEEIEIYAISNAAGELVQATLKRFRKSLSTCSTDCLTVLIGHLAWNLMATFPFIEPDQISKEEAFVMFEKAEMWFNSLFASFHKAFMAGMRVGFFRLAENRHYTYSKIIARDPNNPQFIQAKAWLNRYRPLRRKDDLCDGELIDCAVLGLDGEKVINFTSDNHLDIKNRLNLLKGTLEDAARDVEGWSIKPCWGSVHCISEKGEPLKIVHSFLFDQESTILEPESTAPCS
jgi:hypothetical protein